MDSNQIARLVSSDAQKKNKFAIVVGFEPALRKLPDRTLLGRFG